VFDRVHGLYPFPHRRQVLFRSAALAVKEHSDFALLGADHNRLILNPLYQYHPAVLRKKESVASIVADRQEKN
jgi:hypothetical protein